MKFPVHVTCGYPSYKDAGIKWEDLEYKAWRLTQVAKGKEVKGYTVFGNHKVESTPAGRRAAISLAASDAIGRLRKAGLTGILVPIPASDTVAFGVDFTAKKIADEIAKQCADFTCQPVLRFTQDMGKAAGGKGSRSPRVIKDHLDLATAAHLEQCILLDDVTTSGGHLRGAAAFLRERGIAVIGAYCVAQTVWSRPNHLFTMPPGELDTELTWFD